MATIEDSANKLFKVGEIVLDLSSRLVYRDDQSLILAPKTFDLLVELVRRGRSVARREELIDAVWPGQIVNDETLSQRIRLLRMVLGDDPKNPRYVESVHGWGYRLIAPIAPIEVAFNRPAAEPVVVDEESLETEAVVEEASGAGRRVWPWLLAAIGLVGLIVIFLVWKL